MKLVYRPDIIKKVLIHRSDEMEFFLLVKLLIFGDC